MATKRPRIRRALGIVLVAIVAIQLAAPPLLVLASQQATPINVSPRSIHNTTTRSEINNADTSKRRKRISKRKHDTNGALDNDSKKRSTTSKQQQETGGREAATLRRIKREWRDAVKLGIAYDWTNSKSLGKASSKYSYVRMGPIGKNLLRWHFSIAGPPSSDYQEGIYHGRVLLPKNYPGSPPRIQVLTPSGRFQCGHDICLSASSFHPESWTPQWTVLSLVEALRLHMLTTANEIGGKEDTPEQRRKYAKSSRRWQLGRIDHGRMVQEGIFPWQLQEEEDDAIGEGRVEASDSVVCSLDGGGGGGVKVAIARNERTQHEARVARKRRVQQKASVPTIVFRAVVEVLTSPIRLGILFLLTVFAILNRQ